MVTQDLQYPWEPTRRGFSVLDKLFLDGDVMCRASHKQIQIFSNTDSEQQNSGDDNSVSAFTCHVPQCNKMFETVASYEIHYNSTHRNICSVCRKMLPSVHLLDIHVLENHDSLFMVMATKKNMFQCLVEGCGQVFPDSQHRRDHLISHHKYPPNFRFHQHHKQKRKSKRKGAAENDVSSQQRMEIGADVPRNQQSLTSATEVIVSTDVPMQEKTSATESTTCPIKPRRFTYKVPENITFGQGVSRGFSRRPKVTVDKKSKKKHWHQSQTPKNVDTTVNIDEMDMQDLSQALG